MTGTQASRRGSKSPTPGASPGSAKVGGKPRAMLPANATHSIIHANVAYALTRAMPAARAQP
jgi:hypothetical protein